MPEANARVSGSDENTRHLGRRRVRVDLTVTVSTSRLDEMTRGLAKRHTRLVKIGAVGF